MNKICKIVTKLPTIIAFAVISLGEMFLLLGSGVFENFRVGNYALGALTMIIFAILGVSAISFFVAIRNVIQKKSNDENGILFCLAVLTLVSIVPIVLLWSEVSCFQYFYGLEILPYFIAIVGIIAFFLLIPLSKKKAVFSIIAIASLLVITCCAALVGPSIKKFDMVSDPCVFDTGEDFSIVWATNKDSIGYVTYSFNNTAYKVYDSEKGRMNSAQIHSVHVPYEHLYGNTYTVCNAEVYRNLPSRSKTGKYISSRSYSFANKIVGNKMNVITASDWHGETKLMEKAVANLGSCDLFIMLGDPVSRLISKNEIIDGIIAAGGDVTKGVIPTLYVRGNHETRGEYANMLDDALGYKQLYYTATYGDQRFIVFDSCEDKADSNYKYGGMVVSEDYRTKELDYMETIPPFAGYNIAVTHIPEFTISSDTEGLARYSQILANNSVKLALAGHEHYIDYIQTDYNLFIEGGITNSEKDFIACLIEIDNGIANMTAKNTKNHIIATYTSSLTR